MRSIRKDVTLSLQFIITRNQIVGVKRMKAGIESITPANNWNWILLNPILNIFQGNSLETLAQKNQNEIIQENA